MLKTLLKLNLQMLFASTFSRKSKNGEVKPRSKAIPILLGILFLYCFAMFVVLFATMFLTLGAAVAGTPYRWMYFSIMALLVFAIDFIMTIFTAKSQLFEAKDNETLLALPIHPRDILVSRMLLILLTDYLFEVVIALPALVVWLLLGQGSVLGTLCFLVCLVFMPLLALSCACLVGWLLSLVTSRLKNSAYLTALLSVVLLILYMIVVSNMQSYAQTIATNAEAIAPRIKRYFYPFYCLGDAVANGNLLSALLYILFMALPFVVVCYILSRTFLSLVTRQRGRRSVVYREKAVKARPVALAMLAKEFRRLSSSAAYMLNAGMGLIFLLAIAVGVFFVPIETLSAELEVSVSAFSELAPALAIGVLCLCSSMILFSAPSVSLEGQSIYFLQSLPVRGKDVLLPKAWMHMLLTLPVCLIASVCAIIALPCTPTMAVLLIVFPALYNVFCALLGLVINLALPRFDWISETVVVKQSAAVSVTMLVGMFSAFLYIGIGVALCILLPIPAAMVLLTLPLLGSCIAMYAIVSHRADHLFQKLG